MKLVYFKLKNDDKNPYIVATATIEFKDEDGDKIRVPFQVIRKQDGGRFITPPKLYSYKKKDGEYVNVLSHYPSKEFSTKAQKIIMETYRKEYEYNKLTPPPREIEEIEKKSSFEKPEIKINFEDIKF